MIKLPRAVRAVAEHFERLPGIGPKSAQRLALYLLNVPEPVLQEFAQALTRLKTETVFCETCHHLDNESPCSICSSSNRDQALLCVVASPLDVIALEQTDSYNGLYHVLHGVISPLDRIGPDELYMSDLVERLVGVEELIIATNPTLEGEATSLYIEKLVRERGFGSTQLKITRLGHGLSVGADIEYTDGLTLARALAGRQLLTPEK